MASTFLASEAEEIDESACLASLFNRLIALFPYTIAYINTNNHIHTLINITLQISVCGGGGGYNYSMYIRVSREPV